LIGGGAALAAAAGASGVAGALHFRIRQLAVVGPRGSGKTTLFDHIVGRADSPDPAGEDGSGSGDYRPTQAPENYRGGKLGNHPLGLLRGSVKVVDLAGSEEALESWMSRVIGAHAVAFIASAPDMCSKDSAEKVEYFARHVGSWVSEGSRRAKTLLILSHRDLDGSSRDEILSRNVVRKVVMALQVESDDIFVVNLRDLADVDLIIERLVAALKRRRL
jgi:hypothetical protein